LEGSRPALIFSNFSESLENIYNPYENETLSERLKKLETYCISRYAGRAKANSFITAYLNETNELFCLNPKTGSTSVKFLLHKILNKNSSNHLTGDELHAKIDPLLISKLGQQGWNFEEDLGDKADSLEETLFTREPFTRLAGSYRDKITRNNRKFYYTLITKKILHLKYPNSSIPNDLVEWGFGIASNLTLSFQNFVEYMVGDRMTGTDPHYRAKEWKLYHGWESSPYIGRTFGPDDLVQPSYISDVHFDKQSRICGVCSTKIKFLGKFETIENDLKTLFKNYNLSSTNTINMSFNKHATHSGYESARELYKDLPVPLLHKLYKYKPN